MESPAFDGLPRPERSEILARGTVLCACSPALAALIDLTNDRSPLIVDAMGGFGSAAEHARDAPDDGEAIARLVDAWSERLEALLSIAHRQEERSVLEALRTLVPKAADEDPFANAVGVLADAASALYEDSWVDPTVTVGFLSRHPSPDHPGYAIRALTAGGEIRLMIHAAGFGPSALAALPALLVHELVCHVPARQHPVDNRSPFAEGFMDWAARYYGRVWAARLPAPQAAIYVENEERLYEAVASSEPQLATVRRRGRRAAQYLAIALEQHHGYEQARAQSAVASLAVSLNVVDAPTYAKDGFVARLPYSEDEHLPELVVDVLEGRRPAADVL